jgi:hypothetical protein
VVEVVLDGAATNEESVRNATETSPSMLMLLMDMLSPRSKHRAKREGKAVKFEAEEKQTHIDMLALVTALSKEAQKSQGQATATARTRRRTENTEKKQCRHGNL